MRHARRMQPIRRILVAVKDPGARVLPAVNKAAQIAKGLNSRLTLFHDIATPLYAEALRGRGAGFATEGVGQGIRDYHAAGDTGCRGHGGLKETSPAPLAPGSAKATRPRPLRRRMSGRCEFRTGASPG